MSSGAAVIAIERRAYARALAAHAVHARVSPQRLILEPLLPSSPARDRSARCGRDCSPRRREPRDRGLRATRPAPPPRVRDGCALAPPGSPGAKRTVTFRLWPPVRGTPAPARRRRAAPPRAAIETALAVVAECELHRGGMTDVGVGENRGNPARDEARHRRSPDHPKDRRRLPARAREGAVRSARSPRPPARPPGNPEGVTQPDTARNRRRKEEDGTSAARSPRRCPWAPSTCRS